MNRASVGRYCLVPCLLKAASVAGGTWSEWMAQRSRLGTQSLCLGLLVLLLPVFLACGLDTALADDAPGLSPEFADSSLQLRYRRLGNELRCPKCSNQNLHDSNSMVAQDLRAELIRVLRAGYDDNQIREHFRQRYGDFILYRPRFVGLAPRLLWLLPILLLAAGIVLWLLRRRGRPRPEPAATIAAAGALPAGGTSRWLLASLLFVLVAAIVSYGLRGQWQEWWLYTRVQQSENHEEMLVELQRYHQRHPENTNLGALLATIYVAMDRFEDAAEQYRQLSKRNDERAEEFAQLALLSDLLANVRAQAATSTATAGIGRESTATTAVEGTAAEPVESGAAVKDEEFADEGVPAENGVLSP